MVSSPQLETAEIVTVYRALPEEQFVILLKMPTSPPGAAVALLRVGVTTLAQAEEVVPPPPPPGFPFCANEEKDRSATHIIAISVLIKYVLIIPQPS